MKSATHENENRLMEQWGMWKKAFKKTYETIEEEAERYDFYIFYDPGRYRHYNVTACDSILSDPFSPQLEIKLRNIIT